MRIWFACILFFLPVLLSAQNFRFAFLSDTHIGSPSGGAEEDLRRTVADINTRNDLDFVVLTGDITELGTNKELALAKQLLDALKIPYYIIPGNHDTGWSETGGLGFARTFGDDKFSFLHKGIQFIGCASGPYVRMSDGHVPRSHIVWLQKVLDTIPNDRPIVFLNHYPLDPGLDNWYEVIDLLNTRNTVLALCGHGHNNRKVAAENLTSVMGRSNLRAKAAEGGYNLVDFRRDSIIFTERKPVSGDEKIWHRVANSANNRMNANRPRPSYAINDTFSSVKRIWEYQSDANIISSPAMIGSRIVVGNGNGEIEIHDVPSGNKKLLSANGPIYSSPAADGNRFVLGDAGNTIWCYDAEGAKQWSLTAEGAVLGSPLIAKGIAYIGASDGKFRALQSKSGALIWSFDSVKGAVTSQPVIAGNTIIFGAWDTYLYALNKRSGKLLWKWSNGSHVINYSPAACIPVVVKDVVYVVAPDRYLSAIDLKTGATLWRSKDATVRESIGVSKNGKYVYAKTMQDTLAVFATARTPSSLIKQHIGFGYEHVPSMQIEHKGIVYFGTKNGVVYAVNPTTGARIWAHKIDNSMVNTVSVMRNGDVLASTMNGKIVLLRNTR